MSEELKRCPFCGEHQLPDSEGDGNVPYESGMSKECDFCSATVTHNWNTRPIEDALQARIAKLVNLVEVQHDDNCHLADMCRQRDASIAELEATIDQLIAAGESLTRVAEWRYANLTELLAWDTLVEKIHKEREK